MSQYCGGNEGVSRQILRCLYSATLEKWHIPRPPQTDSITWVLQEQFQRCECVSFALVIYYLTITSSHSTNDNNFTSSSSSYLPFIHIESSSILFDYLLCNFHLHEQISLPLSLTRVSFIKFNSQLVNLVGRWKMNIVESEMSATKNLCFFFMRTRASVRVLLSVCECNLSRVFINQWFIEVSEMSENLWWIIAVATQFGGDLWKREMSDISF